jgi:hypothetical protein
MKKDKLKEIYRADRIAFTIDECNEYLTSMYEHLVDRDFKEARKSSEKLIKELKIIITSMKDDDF